MVCFKDLCSALKFSLQNVDSSAFLLIYSVMNRDSVYMCAQCLDLAK